MTRQVKTPKEKTNLEDNLEANLEANLEDGNFVEGGQVIEPIAYVVKLRSIHPGDSYGRCGYRFYKDKEVTIPARDLRSGKILTLAEDPWLELIPVCKE